MTRVFASFQQTISRNAGYTLIELIIGLLISLFVGGIALTYMLASSQTMVHQSMENRIQESARIAFETLGSNVRLAGFDRGRKLGSAGDAVPGIFREAICAGRDCNRDGATYRMNGVAYNSDALAVDYVVRNQRTCAGTLIERQVRMVIVYWVADLDGDGVASLYCQTHIGELDLVGGRYGGYSAPSPALPLIDGVESLQVQYGVDRDDDGNIDGYVAYPALGAGGLAQIRTVKLGLLISGGPQIAGQDNTEQQQARRYRLMDATIETDDAVLRQSVSTTIFIPNLNRELHQDRLAVATGLGDP